MIPVYKNLFSHRGQGVVWNGPHGPVKGHIEYAVRRFGHPDREITFIVLPDFGSGITEEKTASMLYPNMKAWLKWKTDLIKRDLESLRERRFDKKRSIENLVEAAWDLVHSSYGNLGFTSKMHGIINELSILVAGRGVTMPLCDTIRDVDLIVEMEAEIRRYTVWERRLEKKRKAHEKWLRQQEEQQ